MHACMLSKTSLKIPLSHRLLPILLCKDTNKHAKVITNKWENSFSYNESNRSEMQTSISSLLAYMLQQGKYLLQNPSNCINAMDKHHALIRRDAVWLSERHHQPRYHKTHSGHSPQAKVPSNYTVLEFQNIVPILVCFV